MAQKPVILEIAMMLDALDVEFKLDIPAQDSHQFASQTHLLPALETVEVAAIAEAAVEALDKRLKQIFQVHQLFLISISQEKQTLTQIMCSLP